MTQPDSPIEVIDERDKTVDIKELPADIYAVPKNLQGRLRPLPNLLKDTALPVGTVLQLRKPRAEFSFYPKGATEPMFEIKLSEPVAKLEFTISSLSDTTGITVTNLEPGCTATVVL